MRRFNDLPYRVKLLVSHLSIVLMIVLVITSTVIYSASRQVLESSTANLYQLTEQVLINYTSSVQAAERYLYSMSITSDTTRVMAQLRGASGDDPSLRQELAYCLSKMIDSHAMYDHVAVCMENGLYFSDNSSTPAVSAQSRELLSRPEYAQTQYGKSVWAHTEDGQVYLIRDVYDTSPLRYVGKMGARIRQDMLVTLGYYHDHTDWSVLFFNQEGNLILSAGENAAELEAPAMELLTSRADTVEVNGMSYAACIMAKEDWTAVGFLPMSNVQRLQSSILKSGLFAAALGILVGLLISIAFSRRMTSQISALAQSMLKVKKGDLNVGIKVQGKDEIGMLTEHFNQMTDEIQHLLERVVEEENRKRQAEFMNLEYEYRFLQWQINPHFIYNALETLNAMAKIGGNEELADMIVVLSDYFRQNAEAMRKKFITVRQEFSSLQQYVDIYLSIYGDTLQATFEIASEVEEAYLPTMIIQPLLENALIHGISAVRRSVIRISAEGGEKMLIVSIRDNGDGMPPEVVRRILSGSRATEAEPQSRASLGVHNVQDRMKLLYGNAAHMTIESEIGAGTCVRLYLPLTYEEMQMPFENA